MQRALRQFKADIFQALAIPRGLPLWSCCAAAKCRRA